MRRPLVTVSLVLALAGACGSGGGPPSDTLPGAPPMDAGTAAAIQEAASRPAGARPRTRHLRADGSPRYTNRLVLEASPYLQQHAHNPVDWHPWGDEAFETARRLGRPVLLSVGYSTCHWCHVMEEESFEDEEIARYLNEHYVAIKVDREERPDVDGVYMTAVQALTGGGGWPMTVWLTPDRQPFYGGTYYPARDGDRGVRSGFLTVLRTVQGAYAANPDRVSAAAADLSQTIAQRLTPPPGGETPPQAAVLAAAVAGTREQFDDADGGLRRQRKFPSDVPVRFLLRQYRRMGDVDARRMAEVTLERMAAGGIHDHLGGGFHRYATDPLWLVPHFEKMLYDNALLVLAYLDAFQATGRAEFADVARDVLGWVTRDMTSPAGAFYAATDADSPGPDGRRVEGLFFTWTPDEIDAVLGPDDGRLVRAWYAVTPSGDVDGRSVLHTPRSLDSVADEVGIPRADAGTLVGEARQRLHAARARRPPPLRDEKIVTAWNGLMISAYARAALVLGDPGYATTAARAADVVLAPMRKDGRLVRSITDGRPGPAAYLDDYAFLAAGLVDLYEATGDARWLDEAIALDRVLATHFEDAKGGGFFATSDAAPMLIAREKPLSDGAEPSGNSVHALTLLRLAELTTDDAYRRRAERVLGAAAPGFTAAPGSLGEMLLALDFHLDAPKEIVLVDGTGGLDPFFAALRAQFLPNRVLVVVRGSASPPTAVASLVEGKVALGGRATGYVCERRVCDLPTTDAAVFARQLERVR